MSSKLQHNFIKQQTAHVEHVLGLFDEWASKVACAHQSVQVKAAALFRQLTPFLLPAEVLNIGSFTSFWDKDWHGRTILIPNSQSPIFGCRFSGRPEDWDYFYRPKMRERIRRRLLGLNIETTLRPERLKPVRAMYPQARHSKRFRRRLRRAFERGHSISYGSKGR